MRSRGADTVSEAMTRFLWICLGGAFGTGARYLLSGWLLRVCGPAFPWGTLAVNGIGSFLLALLMVIGVETTLLPVNLRLALTTGVMGGFTTYSTFNQETMQYFQDGAWWMGALNVLITVFGCLLACVLGQMCARWLIGS